MEARADGQLSYGSLQFTSLVRLAGAMHLVQRKFGVAILPGPYEFDNSNNYGFA